MKISVLTASILVLIASGAGANNDNGNYGYAAFGPVRNADFYDNGRPDTAKVELGKALYWDKILSGNRNISCATCHHGLAATGDGLSLSVGEGGNGLGVTRDTGIGPDAIHARVPRNAPPVYNLGAKAMIRMFHDGRVYRDPYCQSSGFCSPAFEALPEGLDNVLAVQAMFPVTSAEEMAGQCGVDLDGDDVPENASNEIACPAARGELAGSNGVWAQLGRRLKADNPNVASTSSYLDLFEDAYGVMIKKMDGVQIYVLAANAIAAYEAVAFRADNSPFDRYLRGDWDAMSAAAERGMGLFYGKAGCADCHSGKFQTDMEFYAIAMPQIGPGKGDVIKLPVKETVATEDFGRERVTGDGADRYRFRTPTLRNVALTGPWGHDGAYDSLRAAVKHHLRPVKSLYSYDTAQAVLPFREDLDDIDFDVHNDYASRQALAEANELQPVHLRKRELDDLMAFLHALTDEGSLDLRDTVPMIGVPSGLPLFD